MSCDALEDTWTALWSFFDGIYCINLLERDDKYQKVQEVFTEYKIPVTFHRVERHPISGVHGCYQSHIDIITKAYNEGKKNILIFEDDAVASAYLTPKHLQKSIDFMSTDNDWQLFYLGSHPEIRTTKSVKVSKNILHFHSLCTHAYAVSERGLATYANTPFMGLAIDTLYKYSKESYGYYPTLFYQGGDGSDIGIDYPGTKYLKRYWFRWMEMYSYYVNIPLVHVSVVTNIFLLILLALFIIRPPYLAIWLFFWLMIYILVVYYFTGTGYPGMM